MDGGLRTPGLKSGATRRRPRGALPPVPPGRDVFIEGMILDVEVACAPGPLLERLDDGCPTTGELVVQLTDFRDDQICVEERQRLSKPS